jgi:hypothetical protein
MFRIETATVRTRDAERFKTAFYRFLEAHPPPAEEAAWLEAWLVEGEARQVALLWSQEAADAFRAYAANYPQSAARPMRIGRFDDLGL